ncbi:zf-TFIIB domain-containing protein [Noviherbaspirillum agri]
MQCPVCTNTQLVMSERQGIEIDYCPQCRGVWLDRGELDKIIERSAATAPAPAFGHGTAPPPRDERRYGHPDQHYQQPQQHQPHYKDDYHYRKKKKGFLGELFDFD